MSAADSPRVPLNVPVRPGPANQSPVRADGPGGIGLCLSGGGYRAMLFHVGGMLRLNEAGVLRHVRRVSSVSGGSITAAVLGMNWMSMGLDRGDATLAAMQDYLVDPIRRLAARTIDVASVLVGAILPGLTISDRVASAYDEHLFRGATLQDLPDDSNLQPGTNCPRFVINATNVQTGSLWRFSRPYMADWQVGQWKNPQIPLAVAVAASSAFPPVLSPCTLDLDTPPDPVVPGAPVPPYQKIPFISHAVLSDGGVYDNLGLETAFKRCDTLLVSDGGMKIAADPEPHTDWVLHSKRILDLIDNQVRSLRKRQLIQSFIDNVRTGAYWGITTHLEDYFQRAGRAVEDPFGYLSPGRPAWQDTADLASTPTRLAAMESWRQEALIDWGYAVCHTALDVHAGASLAAKYQITIQPPPGLPYPAPE